MIMKEDNKYYTPDIEEFHVGFEYELLKPDSKYYKRVFGYDPVDNPELDEFSPDDLMKIAHAITRVKHLDREDIEGFGFDNDGQMEFDSGNWGPVYNLSVDNTEYKEKYYNLFIDEGLFNIVFCEYRNSVGRTEKTLFSGTIKNKSELKKVLNMIGVIK